MAPDLFHPISLFCEPVGSGELIVSFFETLHFTFFNIKIDVLNNRKNDLK